MFRPDLVKIGSGFFFIIEDMLLCLTAVYSNRQEPSCPGCKADEMLCLVGQQGAGKSTFFRFLALNDDWFSDDLKQLNDSKIYEHLRGHWIMEMSEMIAAISAKSNEEIKSFLTRQKDTYRNPYDKYEEDRKRLCIFAGSTNTRQFIPFSLSGRSNGSSNCSAFVSFVNPSLSGSLPPSSSAPSLIQLLCLPYPSFENLWTPALFQPVICVSIMEQISFVSNFFGSRSKWSKASFQIWTEHT